MPVRVELIDDAIEDLERVARTGSISLFLAKLVYLEEHGKAAGLPLGRELTNWHKIVVGNRNWRIIFTTDPEETVATVWVIGDRADSECYDVARKRVAALGKTNPEAKSLASAMLRVSKLVKSEKRTKTRK